MGEIVWIGNIVSVDKSDSEYPAAAHDLDQAVRCAWDSRSRLEVQSKDVDKA